MFVGSPKIGKSFFMAQIGYHISKGLPLWGFTVRQIDEECNQMMDRLVEQMKEKQGVTEELKMQNQMAWVRGMNNIWACAEEIIYKSILYR